MVTRGKQRAPVQFVIMYTCVSVFLSDQDLPVYFRSGHEGGRKDPPLALLRVWQHSEGRAGQRGGSGPALSCGRRAFWTSCWQRGCSVTGDGAENHVTEADWPRISMTVTISTVMTLVSHGDSLANFPVIPWDFFRGACVETLLPV